MNTNKIKMSAIVILLILSAALATYIKNGPTEVSANADTTEIEGVYIQPLSTDREDDITSGDADSITCQKSSDNIYGGINRGANNPPDGTAISQELTKRYGRLAATGICGTYQYIAGWWFSQYEISKLPYQSLMYGMSPYALEGGSSSTVSSLEDSSSEEYDDTYQPPIAPVPEISTVILIALGLSMFVIYRKMNK